MADWLRDDWALDSAPSLSQPLSYSHPTFPPTSYYQQHCSLALLPSRSDSVYRDPRRESSLLAAPHTSNPVFSSPYPESPERQGYIYRSWAVPSPVSPRWEPFNAATLPRHQYRPPPTRRDGDTGDGGSQIGRTADPTIKFRQTPGIWGTHYLLETGADEASDAHVDLERSEVGKPPTSDQRRRRRQTATAIPRDYSSRKHPCLTCGKLFAR